MPTLESIVTRIVPLNNVYQDVVQKLKIVGITTTKSFLTLRDADLSAITLVPLTTFKNFRREILFQIAPPAIRGADLITVDAATRQVLPTGCATLDSLIGGGLVTTEITEFSGPPATGKTQVAFSATANTLVRNPYATVLWIDTQNAFSAERIAQIAGGEEVLRRVKIIYCFDIWALLEALDAVNRECKDVRRMDKENDEFWSRLVMVVIDSVSSILSTLLTTSQTQGHALMVNLGRMLKRLAQDFALSILIITSSVSTASYFPFSAFTSTITKPALGSTWTEIPDLQIYFGFVGWNRADKCEERDRKRVIEVVRSRRMTIGQWDLFQIGVNGIS